MNIKCVCDPTKSNSIYKCTQCNKMVNELFHTSAWSRDMCEECHLSFCPMHVIEVLFGELEKVNEQLHHDNNTILCKRIEVCKETLKKAGALILLEKCQ